MSEDNSNNSNVVYFVRAYQIISYGFGAGLSYVILKNYIPAFLAFCISIFSAIIFVVLFYMAIFLILFLVVSMINSYRLVTSEKLTQPYGNIGPFCPECGRRLLLRRSTTYELKISQEYGRQKIPQQVTRLLCSSHLNPLQKSCKFDQRESTKPVVKQKRKPKEDFIDLGQFDEGDEVPGLPLPDYSKKSHS